MPTCNIIEAAKELIGKGYAVTPVVSKTKVPKLKDWPNKTILASEVEQNFLPTDNVAIVLGEKSGGLTDVDFDHPIAKGFACFLPETTMIHGRPGNPTSHFWFRLNAQIKSRKFAAPNGKVVIELRSAGCMTMVPPSIHPGGDQLAWEQHGSPASVDAVILYTLVAKIAAATLLALNWPQKGSRNDAALALAGCLLRAGWEVSGTADFISRVAKVAGDEECAQRAECVGPTAAKLKAGQPATGMPKLSSLMGPDIVSRVADWLCLEKSSGHGELIDAIVEDLNKRHAVVSIGGGTWILNEIADAATNLPNVTFSRPSDFRLKYANRNISDEPGDSIAISDVWLEHPNRREFEGIEFAPETPHPSFYNLWRGFAVEPVPGECHLYLAHVKENICQGNEVLYRYVISWMAHATQHPGELPGTALVLRGAQGVGKGVFVENFGKLFGQHYLTVYRLSQITGRFNGHLKNLLVVHANEAVWGGHKEAEGALKGMVTDPMMPIEAKGKDIIQLQNFKRLIVSSNEQWAVPLDLDDRRFLILDVSSAHKEDHAYFAAIELQMQNGGWEALMHMLAIHDLSKFNVRKLPQTDNGLDIKLLSANHTTNWWFEQLSEGALSNVLMEKSAWYKVYQEWCADHKKGHPADFPIFAKELKKLVPTLKTEKHKVDMQFPGEKQKRASFFIFPTLDECRKHFETLTKSGPNIWTT